jgi:hypothetical protein
VESSEIPLLDQAAMQIARTRWQFQPGTLNGQPAESTARIDVEWNLPAERVAIFNPVVPSLPEGAQLPVRTSNPLAGLNTPLGFAVRQRMQGITRLKFFIRENGSISEMQVVDSSGYERLDACN